MCESKEERAKVLIVDDEKLNLDLLTHLLSPYYRILLAKNGQQALQRLESSCLPDIILLDITMPGMNGYEVCQQVKSNPRIKDIPIIFITASTSEQHETKGFAMGGVDYITKPYNPVIVLARVKTHIEMKKRGDLLAHYVKMVDKHIIISSTDCAGVITYASDAFCNISGYTREELLGQPHSIIRHPDMPKATFQAMWDTLLKGENWHGEIKNRKRNGDHYWVDAHIEANRTSDGTIVGYTAIRQNITDKKRIEELSVTDRLTQLYNRLRLDEAFRCEVARSRRYGHPLSVILFDVDHFKSVNDTHGHQVGDQVLIHMAQVLKSNVRQSDIPGRWGGEEFLVICPETDESGVFSLAEKLRQAIAAYDFPTVGHKTSSFGVGTIQPEETINGLVHRVDVALYQAKKKGRNRVERSASTSDHSRQT
ncbi:MAG: diguanylate cyclase [Magnetococcus sp. YQC-5]